MGAVGLQALLGYGPKREEAVIVPAHVSVGVAAWTPQSFIIEELGRDNFVGAECTRESVESSVGN